MTPATQPVVAHTDARPDLESLLERRLLTAHFQPIVDLRSVSVYGHESLIRGPIDAPFVSPAQLFEAARRAALVTALELECGRTALECWSSKGAVGKLFVNFSASALVAIFSGTRLAAAMDFLAGCGLPASMLVVELTEHERVLDDQALQHVVDLLRLQGVQFALDDFGDGRSSLRLWSELRPDYVKIDQYFTRGVAEDANKLQTFRAMLQIAETFGAQLIAEGIETAAELRVLRDLEVRYGQGFYLGRPQIEPAAEPSAQSQEVLRSRHVAVLPVMRTAANNRFTAASLLVQAPTVDPSNTHDEVFALFSEREDLHAVAVLQGDQPLGLLDRHQFISRYARPFFRELYGRRSCLLFATREPLLLEASVRIEELTSVLTAADQRYLSEGFIVTEQGCYRGLGTGQALVKAVTEVRIEAARHANPLTFLPGNIPVGQHIERMLAIGGTFAVAHADLDHFKSYNDHYGYWRGDEMIRLAAAVIAMHCDAERDFVGHVGGDDFVIVFQSEDWATRCRQIVRHFKERAPELFDTSARLAGGLLSDDRQGEKRFHPCTTISIGVTQINGARHHSAEDVSAAAAAAKRIAKQQALGLYATESDAA